MTTVSMTGGTGNVSRPAADGGPAQDNKSGTSPANANFSTDPFASLLAAMFFSGSPQVLTPASGQARTPSLTRTQSPGQPDSTSVGNSVSTAGSSIAHRPLAKPGTSAVLGNTVNGAKGWLEDAAPGNGKQAVAGQAVAAQATALAKAGSEQTAVPSPSEGQSRLDTPAFSKVSGIGNEVAGAGEQAVPSGKSAENVGLSTAPMDSASFHTLMLRALPHSSIGHATTLAGTVSLGPTQQSASRMGNQHKAQTAEETNLATAAAAVNGAAISGAGMQGLVPNTVQNTAQNVAAPAVTFGDLQSLYGVTHAAAQVSATGQHVLQVQVHPAGLGSILVSVAQTPNGVSVGLQANNMQVTQWLSQHAQALQTKLQDSGLTVNQFAVSFGDASLQGNGHGSSERRQKSAEAEQRTSGVKRASSFVGLNESAGQAETARSLGWQGSVYGGWI